MITRLVRTRAHSRWNHFLPRIAPDDRGVRRYSSSSQPETERLLVVGSGVAGCAAALLAAESYKIPVTLLYAGQVPHDCNSNWAQGGIIYRNYNADSGDSSDLLAQDIHRAGARLCVDEAVQKVAQEGPGRVRQLLLEGGPYANVPFDRTLDGELSLCLEASHSAPRILHFADHTGMIITKHMTEAVARHPLIQLKADTLATDLIIQDGHCLGVSTLHRTTAEQRLELASHGTVLASGGLAGVYQHSTNPPGFNALGSSVALAVRGGVQTQDLEYVQFHPTALFVPNEARFLLSEALRGEGAILRDADGRAFAKDFHADGELAPRDIVARGVFEEAKKSSDSSKHNVFLDISHRDSQWLHGRFPSIQSYLKDRGLDMAKDHLPITPAAHYTCGGISTDLLGRTSMPGLYAAGEAARTGLHGGNRLASTSLLEGLVFGSSIADFVGSEQGDEVRNELSRRMRLEFPQQISANAAKHSTQVDEVRRRAEVLLSDLKQVMWDQVGVVRTASGLGRGCADLAEIRAEACDLYDLFPTISETVGLRDAAFASEAVAKAASMNMEPAGAHYVIPDATDTEGEEEIMVASSQ